MRFKQCVFLFLGWSMGIYAQKAPDFTATDINGKAHHLYEYLDQKKFVLLDFTASW